MKILLYGGGFNPPHLGHRAALMTAQKLLKPDRTLIIPDGMPPHKLLPSLTPAADVRLMLCALNFASLPDTEISKIAISREGPSYMVDTLSLLRRDFPEDELILLMGSDMLLTIDQWYRAGELLQMCTLAALCRKSGEGSALREKVGELEQRGVSVSLLEHEPVPVSSSKIRSLLPKRQGRAYLSDAVYGEIIRLRLYEAKPDLGWLREQVPLLHKPKRVAHVLGCADTARRMALRWGLDPDAAEEAGLLHDCTKRWTEQEQLAYCDRMGIVLTEGERANPQLLHARTGAVFAHERFGCPEDICDAIRWHTTGKPGMNPFEMLLYLADMIEPNRTYAGTQELRKLADEDLNRCMCHALQRSMEILQERNMQVYQDTLEACRWYESAYGN